MRRIIFVLATHHVGHLSSTKNMKIVIPLLQQLNDEDGEDDDNDDDDDDKFIIIDFIEPFSIAEAAGTGGPPVPNENDNKL
jgi:hypothetical protein